MAESPDDIVGHKTLGDGSHLPLTRAEANALLKACDEAKAKRDTLMPDEKAALRMFMDAWLRLKDFGFSEAIYCPKDGSHFQVIEAGSTGIHDCRYRGEWTKGSWEVHCDGDIWPSRPVLYRLYPEDEAKRKAKMAEAARRFAEMDQE